MIELTPRVAKAERPYRAGWLWLALIVFCALVASAWVLEQSRQDPLVVREWLGRVVDVPETVKIESTLSQAVHWLALIEASLLVGALVITSRTARHHRNLHRALEEQMKLAQATFDALPAQVGIIDGTGRLLASNANWKNCDQLICDTRLPRLAVGANFLETCDRIQSAEQAQAASVAEAIRGVLAGKIGSTVIECAAPVNQGDSWFVLRISPFPVKGGNGAVLLFDDVTQQKMAEQQVQRSREAADHANAAKSAFLANMSHEIRTPMAAIIGYADLLQDVRQSPEQRSRSVQIIRRNGEHLLGIINDILDLSKIEANKLTVEKIRTSLPSFFCDVAVVARQRAEEKGLKFSVVFDGPVPQSIHADPLRMKQVLLNLLSNAVKFTQQGSVTLRVACESLLDTSRLQCDVIDTGIGMNDEQRDRLFTPFTQGDEKTTRRFGGTGLGLSISRRLATLLGGDIVLQSARGVGTTASFWIDAGPLQGVPMIEELREHDLSFEQNGPRRGRLSRPARVLLAEDGEDNRDLLTAFLQDAGVEVVCAENGAAAIDLAMKQSCDLVLMDMQMPEVDGYTAATRLRKQDFCKPIIALTANAMTDDRRKCLEAGCDEYLSKPVDRDRLVSTIAKLLGISLVEDQTSTESEVATPEAISDLPKLQSNRANDPQLATVLARFVDRLPARVAEINSHRDSSNSAELSRALHQLKGAAGGYGFPDVSVAAAGIEGELRAGKSVADVDAALTHLLSLIERIHGYPGADAASKPRLADQPAAPRPGGRLPRIMLVDDSPDTTSRFRAITATLNVELRTYSRPEAALSDAREFAPSVVLVDVNIGGMNGFDFRAALAEIPECEHTIALLLTDAAFVSASDCALLPDDRLVSPEDAAKLKTEIAAALERCGAARELGARIRVDAETGLPNLRYVQSRLPTELSASRRDGASLCCMIVTLTDPATLANIAQPEGASRVIAAARVVGEAFPQSTIARIAPNEFLIAQIGLDRFSATDSARMIVQKLEAAATGAGQMPLAAEARFAMASQHAANADELIRNTRSSAPVSSAQKRAA